MESVLAKLVSGKLSIYAAIVLMFIYSLLLDRDFTCTCKPQDVDCNLYLFVPVFIIFLLILWIDTSFQTVCRYLCTGKAQPHTCSFLGSSLRKLLKALLIGLLWVAFVLIEADWYVCCKNDRSEQQAQLACKDKEKNLTHADRILIAELKNDSRAIGGFVLFGIIVVASIITLLRWSKCCGESNCCSRNVLYDEFILEEKENALKEILKDVAKEEMIKVKEKIRRGRWKDVAAVLMKIPAREQRGQPQENQEQHQEWQQEQELEQELERGSNEDDPLLV